MQSEMDRPRQFYKDSVRVALCKIADELLDAVEGVSNVRACLRLRAC